MSAPRISVVTPTLRRSAEVEGLLHNLAEQTAPPAEVILVDAAPDGEHETESVVLSLAGSLPFALVYVRHGGGTAIQRNVGLDRASGEFVAFVDDDVRLEPDFFAVLLEVFAADAGRRVGGVVGYRTNQHFAPDAQQRWRWYRRLRLLSTFEPGRYDRRNGYPINANMQPPFTGTRSVDFMTTACAMWRREVFDDGLRFDPFFRDYGILEDAHLALRAGRSWTLLQCGDARCRELHSPSARERQYLIGYKSVVNYYYVFSDIAGPLSARQRLGFWRYQCFELLRTASSAVRRRRRADLSNLRGRLHGFFSVLTGGYREADR